MQREKLFSLTRYAWSFVVFEEGIFSVPTMLIFLLLMCVRINLAARRQTHRQTWLARANKTCHSPLRLSPYYSSRLNSQERVEKRAFFSFFSLSSPRVGVSHAWNSIAGEKNFPAHSVLIEFLRVLLSLSLSPSLSLSLTHTLGGFSVLSLLVSGFSLDLPYVVYMWESSEFDWAPSVLPTDRGYSSALS